MKTRSCFLPFCLLAIATLTPAAFADHNCCELAPPQGCASGPLVTASTCDLVGGAFNADQECSLSTGNCVAKTASPDAHVCCLDDCVNTMTGDPLEECFEVLDIPTVSEWGVLVMLLLVLTAGTVVVMRRRQGALDM